MEAQDYHLKVARPQSAALHPTVTDALYDDVQLSEEEVSQEADEATMIFHKAGVTTSWIACKRRDHAPKLAWRRVARRQHGCPAIHAGTGAIYPGRIISLSVALTSGGSSTNFPNE